MSAPEIFFVVAAATNRVIGRDGKLPWHLSSDLKHFKELTFGLPMVMGRRTHASIGRPLPGRTTIVVSRDPDLVLDGVEIADSLDAAFAIGRRVAEASGAGAIAVVGGGEIYAAALPFATRIELTEVALEPYPRGAALFPVLDPAEWRETARVAGVRTERDEADFAFVTLRRR
ncbi:dihydrofolate reductase [Siculibacillus lacustris]|uniref:Dihydrofolate reductase n=1 Tax=Siculibacillus lacustris TaxID=1549641 RepID=A0A4Q9VS74_9HYPH|nr:dihydrofolate reductase [Siculibacillus lacustris]TBW38675.1 dihydrofolate reductase [Siculibacillus lacustris]